MGGRRSNDLRAEALLDRDLVEQARSGDQKAFKDLVYQVSDPLLGVARRILRDPVLAAPVLVARRPLVDPGTERVAFLLGHVRHVAERHGLGDDRHLLDPGRLGLDLLGCVEHHPERRLR